VTVLFAGVIPLGVTKLGSRPGDNEPMRSAAHTLTWRALHGGFRGVSADHQREYHIQSIAGYGVRRQWAENRWLSVDVVL
jgi:hypothetical protein